MAPRTEFSTEQVRAKSRKDLLYLLEGVSYGWLGNILSATRC